MVAFFREYSDYLKSFDFSRIEHNNGGMKVMRKLWYLLILITSLFLIACSSSNKTETATGDNKENSESNEALPDVVSMSSYDTGSVGYVQAATFGEELKKATGTSLRSVPADNDVSRLSPLRSGDVDLTLTGVGAILGFQGRYEFANEDWGPQDVRTVWMGIGDQSLGVNTATDAGIETVYDLKGKRVAYIVGAPSLNLPMEAYLAFAELSWDDVTKVEFPSTAAAFDALIANQVDAVYAGSTVPKFEELATSSRGYTIAKVPHDDEEGWKRLKEVAPWLEPLNATQAAGNAASTENPVESGASPYPILIAETDKDPNLIYEFSKQIHELYDEYSGELESLEAWHVDRLMLPFSIPYHEGTIRYLEEINVWTEEDDEWNQLLIEEYEATKEAFDQFIEENKDLSEEDLIESWEKEREKVINEINS